MIVVAVFLVKISSDQKQQLLRQTETNQFLYSTFSMDAMKQRYILFMRDKIIERWKETKIKVNYDRAYKIAEINYREFAKYPFLTDPLFLLAIQRKESNFGTFNLSPTGARGIMQIMPLTGRFISPSLGVAYSDTVLSDDDLNIRLASKYLEIMYAAYPNFQHILVGYNAGPSESIERYKRNKKDLPSETAEYVPSVMKIWNDYKEQIKTYRADSSFTKR